MIASSISWVTTVFHLIQLELNISLSNCDNNDLGVHLNYFEFLCKKEQFVDITVNILSHSNKINFYLLAKFYFFNYSFSYKF